MCQIDQREGTVSFAAIRRVLRELFAKNHGGSIRPPPTSARVKLVDIFFEKVKQESNFILRTDNWKKLRNHIHKNVSCVEFGPDQLKVFISTREVFTLKLLHRKWSLYTTYAFKQIKQAIAPGSRNTMCPEIDARLMRPVMLSLLSPESINFTGSGTRHPVNQGVLDQGTRHLNPPSTGIWRLNLEAEAAQSQDVALTYRGPEVRKLDFVQTDQINRIQD